MAYPTRGQIDTTTVNPTYKIEILDTAYAWQDITNSVMSVSGSVATGNDSNGLAFGSSVLVTGSIVVLRDTVSGVSMESPALRMTKIRVYMKWDTSDFVQIFTGVIRGIQSDGDQVTYDLTGIDAYLNNVKIYTSVYRRKMIALSTGLVSDDPSVVTTGLLNELFWRAGGRPYGQGFVESATVKFFYQCTNSLQTPEYSWISGENMLDEAYVLVRAAGGQLYQDDNGVLNYVQPLLLAAGSQVFTITDSMFGTYAKQIASELSVGTIKSTYTPRELGPTQEVYADTNQFPIQASAFKDFQLETQLPVYIWDATTPITIVATTFDGNTVTPTLSNMVYTATRVTGRMTNPNSTQPIVIQSIKLRGRPIIADEDKTTSYGSTQPERTLENNVYVQTIDAANRLCNLVYDFYTGTRPTITLGDMFFDPDRYVGEIVKLSSIRHQIYNGSIFVNDTATNLRIQSMTVDLASGTMSLTLTPVDNIPVQNNMYIVGTSYATTDTRLLSY